MRLLILLLFLLTSSLIGREASLWVIVLGDSLTEGLGVTRGEAFPTLVEKGLHENGFGAAVINAGISGSTTAGAARRLKPYFNQDPEVLILALGANDGMRGLSLKAMEKNLSEAIDLAQENGMEVLLAGMKIPPNYGRDYAVAFEKVYERLAKEHSVARIPFLLSGVAGRKELNQPDGIHPNSKGHEIIAKTVLTHLLNLLKSRSQTHVQGILED